MDKDNLNNQIINYIDINFINSNVNLKPIKKGFMFLIPGPDTELGKWKKENEIWVWVYNDKDIDHNYKYLGIEPKFLGNKKWAFAGIHPELSFSTIEGDTKIIYFDKNSLVTKYSIDYLVNSLAHNDLKNYLSTLKTTEANTYFKNFNFNPDQIKFILSTLKIETKSDEESYYSQLQAGSWIYVGKSPKSSLPVWFFVVESKDYYISGYNWYEGDEPKFDEETKAWATNKNINKEFKTSTLPDFVKTYLIEKQIIEGGSYDNITIENEFKEVEDNKNQKISLYERAMKGEFKNIVKKNVNKFQKFLDEDEFASEKEIEYKNIKIMQTNKTFQLSYDEVLAEIKRVNAKDLFDDSIFIKSNETIDEENKIIQRYDPLEFLENFNLEFSEKCKSTNFCIIELASNEIITVFKNDKINSQELNFQKLNLIIKSSKKTAYFKLDEKNFIMEKLSKNQYVLIQKDESFSISDKFKCKKMIEELQAGYKI